MYVHVHVLYTLDSMDVMYRGCQCLCVCASPSAAGGCVQSSVQKPKEQAPAELLHDRTPTGNA